VKNGLLTTIRPAANSALPGAARCSLAQSECCGYLHRIYVGEGKLQSLFNALVRKFAIQVLEFAMDVAAQRLAARAAFSA